MGNKIYMRLVIFILTLTFISTDSSAQRLFRNLILKVEKDSEVSDTLTRQYPEPYYLIGFVTKFKKNKIKIFQDDSLIYKKTIKFDYNGDDAKSVTYYSFAASDKKEIKLKINGGNKISIKLNPKYSNIFIFYERPWILYIVYQNNSLPYQLI
jgi:hypothetical protein